MRSYAILAGVAYAATTSATYSGFNYGSTFTDGSNKQQSDFEAEFNRAKSLQGTNGEFTSARLYTMIQGGTTDTPISAIPAAIDTQTSLLLGLWASAGQADFSNELTALKSAINQYGTAFTSLVAGISVGSEDLYRISPTGIENDSGAGAEPSELASYIGQVRSAIAGTAASGLSVGHVDTWTAWVNGSNDAVISACDWLGMDAYPYFQTTMANGISVGKSLFFDAYDATVAASEGKPVWITETGWPVSGPTENQAVASVNNAETYWQDVACTVLGKYNTFWYTLQDAQPDTPSPSFGIVDSDLSSAPLYDLTCSNGNTAPSSSSTSSVSSTASSATQPASASGSNSETLITTPGPETSPTSISMSQTTMVSASVTSTKSSPPTTLSAPASTKPTTPAAPSGTSCPANLNGEYQFPHLIIPVNSDEPDTAYGTQYNGMITPTISSIFNFDVPSSYSGNRCSLVFFFPDQASLVSSSYTFNGQGGMTVNALSAPASADTTYNNVPKASTAGIGSVLSAAPGSTYVISTGSCAAGQTIAYEFESTGGLSLSWFQDMAEPPIGVFLLAC